MKVHVTKLAAAQRQLSAAIRMFFADEDEFPGMGGVGGGASFVNNYKALAALRVKMRVVHAAGDLETSMR